MSRHPHLLSFSSNENIRSNDNNNTKVTKSCSATQTQGWTGCWSNLARRISSSTHTPAWNADERPNVISCNFRASQAKPTAANKTKNNAAALCKAICVSLPLYGISTTSPTHAALRYIVVPAICRSCAFNFLPVCKSKNIVTVIAHKKKGSVYNCSARWLNVTQWGCRIYAVTIHRVNRAMLPRISSLSVLSLVFALSIPLIIPRT